MEASWTCAGIAYVGLLNCVLASNNVPVQCPERVWIMQLEEELETGLKLSVRVDNVLHSGRSEFQTVELVESEPFGKARHVLNHSTC